MSRPSAAAAARRRPAGRRGTILIVVLALLTIFAVVGIAFVFYSDGEMTAARYAREAENRNGSMIPPPPAFDEHAELALRTIIFGTDPNQPNPPDGVTDPNNQLNAFRGHDLLSAIYGAYGKQSGDVTKLAGPYSGPGIIHEDLNTSTWTNKDFAAVGDRAHVVNHTVITVNGKNLVFDPEITGEPRDATAAAPPSDLANLKAGTTYVPKNAAYTYPDLNNFYLASLSPATGEVLVPSYFRPWHFNAKNPNASRRLEQWNPADPETQFNTDWVTVEGRARTLRPRPIDQLKLSEIPGGKLLTEAQLAALGGAGQAALYKAIDDRIRDPNDPILGYPRPNADGTTTGDVFSVIGGVGVQKNDSILIDFGFKPFIWPQGSSKKIVPLIAVTITDTDGLLNLNAHGNVRNNGTHISYHGFGPWEVNLEAATSNKAEASTLVSSRYGSLGSPKARDGTTDNPFDPSKRRLGLYAPVNWDAMSPLPMGTPPVALPSYPTGGPYNPFAVVPNYATGFYDDNTDPNKGLNHPSIFNPSDWAGFPEGKSLSSLPGQPSTYPHSDTRRLRQRYAGELDLYQQSTFNKLASSPAGTLVGSFPAGPTYRQDPAHPRRLLFTTLSAGLDLPGAAPLAKADDAFTLPAAKGGAAPPVHAGNLKLSAGTGWTSAQYAKLGPADLNRPLADYRGTPGSANLAAELSSSNITNADQAWADRHNLARDVFIRLVVATGAGHTSGVSIDSSTGNLNLPTPDGSEAYNGLRYLAQLAVNIVDYVDGDDVSTMFVWNPPTSTSSTQNVLAPVSATAFTDVATAALTDAQTRDGRVVFGVEVPRLVLNEVYSEVVEDNPKGQGKGKADGLARFWVELLNPTTPASPPAAKDGVIGTGKVVLKDAANPAVKPYKLVITRAKKGADSIGDDIRYNPANVAGDPNYLSAVAAAPKAFTPDIEYDFTTGKVPSTELPPNNGEYNPSGDPTKGVIVVGPTIAGSDPTKEFTPAALAPQPPWAKNMIETPGAPAAAGTKSTGLEYRIAATDMATFDPTKAGSEQRRNVVLLRRLANPYVAESPTNPYVTVDVMDYVPSNDAVTVPAAAGQPLASRTAFGRVQPYAGQAYPDDPAANTFPTYSFPTSCLLAQAPATAGMNEPKHTFGRHNGTTDAAPGAPTVVPAPTNPGERTPVTGLNAGETIYAPYDWLTHLDRSLVNQLELLLLRAGKPHEVTYYFVQPPAQAGEPIRRQVGLAPWFGVAADPATLPQVAGSPYTIAGQGRSGLDLAAQSANGLYRGLEYLRVRPWTYGAASGGRVYGRVNLNTVQDIRIWTALTDAQAASGFTGPQSDALWTAYITSKASTGTPGGGARTYLWDDNKKDAIGQKWMVPIPGETVDDANVYADPNNYYKRLPSLDRPFKAFGVADSPPPSTSGTWTPPSPVVSPAGSGLQDTILRATADATTKTNLPILWSGGDPKVQTHPYLESELPRKLLNNTTTVSNVFCVHLTIVYHEVRDPDPIPPGDNVTVATSSGTQTLTRRRFGREAFREVPGDMRQQYLFVVDRSTALTRPDTNGTDQTAVKTPFFAALAQGVKAGDSNFSLTNATANGTSSVVLYTDGTRFDINDKNPDTKATPFQLIVGSGLDAEIVTVSSVNAGTLTISGTFARPHPGGTVVTNGSTGRPTQPGSNFNPIRFPGTFEYRMLIPYAGRVR